MPFSLKQEILRKAVHVLAILILIIYWIILNNYNKQTAILVLTAILMLFIIFEYIRIETNCHVPLVSILWKHVRRDKEKDKMGGDIFLLTGLIFALAVFDTRIAMAAILMTIFGDLSAALIGKRFGRTWLTKLDDRAWEGIIAELGVNILIGIIIFFTTILPNPLSITAFQPWLIIIVMSLVATFVETIIYKIDDNLVIPIFAGFAGQMVQTFS